MQNEIDVQIKRLSGSRRELFEVSGPPGCGKTTFLQILKTLVGDAAVEVEAHQLNNAWFHKNLEGAKVLLIEEVTKGHEKTLVPLLSQPHIEVEEKGKEPYLTPNPIECIFYTVAS